jgi:uncharacterized protein YraI
MLSNKASTLIVFGTIFGFIIIGSILKGPDRVYKVPSPKTEISSPVTKPEKTEKIVETVTLFAKGNIWVYSGPGKDYNAVFVLSNLERVTVEKNFNENGWLKLTSPGRGYAYHRFFYTVEQAESILLRKLE